MKSGIIILETVDPIASIIQYLSGDKNNYIGFYFTNNDGTVLVRIYETLSGLTPGWFPSYVKIEHIFNKIPFIKRITYYEAKQNISDIVKDLIIDNKDDEVVYKYLLQYLLTKNELSIMSSDVMIKWTNGYKFINNTLLTIMGSMDSNVSGLYLINNNVVSKPIKMINEVIKYDNNIIFNRLFGLAKHFVELYTNNTDFKNYLDKRFLCLSVSVTVIDKESKHVDTELDNLKEDIRKLYNLVRTEEKSGFNLTDMISNYNILVEKLGSGTKFDEDVSPISSNINIYTHGTLDIYAYIPKNIHTNISLNNHIKIKDHNNLLLNSEIDGEIIIPINACSNELSNYSTNDLTNILILVNALNTNDNRFAYLQNKIVEILALRS